VVNWKQYSELLRLGANASMTVVAGEYGTPLHQAALKGHKEIVSVLLDAGCPTDVVDIEGFDVVNIEGTLKGVLLYIMLLKVVLLK
jgi:hypothetical protein